MPKARKRKEPVTRVEAVSPTSSSTPQSSRTIIRRFHVLSRRKTQLQHQTNGTATQAEALAEVEEEINRIGGLELYQRMSAIGQGNDRGGGSERVLIAWLKEMGMSNPGQDKLRLLEVGALKPDNYVSCASWIAATPMDLRSRHPSILEQDFLLMNEEMHHEKWDLISLSLVLNFVPKPAERGRMLRLAHGMIIPKGYLFLVLPLPCVLNSRYLTIEHLRALMSAAGFEQIKERWRQGGKMIYWLYQKRDLSGAPSQSFGKKSVLKQGNRNNFSILL
ncbi:putative methyltransferase-domain-containing protein [Infundibulicybe gibba]|nr:putative methyltransferase-domain-containing protein [Infundibulicybe gibba]